MLALVASAFLGGASSAGAWGTVNGLGQTNEHERITRTALECSPAPQFGDYVRNAPWSRHVPGRCFEIGTTYALAGSSAKLTDHPITGLATDSSRVGAVGAPDMDEFFDSLPHCTDGDFLPGVAYPRSQSLANEYLAACRRYLLRHFAAALDRSRDLVDPRTGAIVAAETLGGCHFIDGRTGLARFNAFLLRAALKIQSSQKVRFFFSLPLSTLVERIRDYFRFQLPLARQSAKCRVLGHFGRVLHVAQDFYAHSNWTDSSDPGRQEGIHNPPGLGQTTRAPLLNPLSERTIITRGLITACFSFPLLDECNGRIDHDLDLAKDKGDIRIEYATKAPWQNEFRVVRESSQHPRSRGLNFLLAAEGAVRETRGLWKDFGTLLMRRYPRDGGTMICVLTHDNPSRDCPERVFRYRVTIEVAGASSSWAHEHYRKDGAGDPNNYRGSGRGTSSWRAEWDDVRIRLNRTSRRVFTIYTSAVSFSGRASGELTDFQYYNSPIEAKRNGSTCRYDETGTKPGSQVAIAAAAVQGDVVKDTYDNSEVFALTVLRGPGTTCAGSTTPSLSYAYDGTERCQFLRGSEYVAPFRIPIARLGEKRVVIEGSFRHNDWGCFTGGGLGDAVEYCGPPLAPGYCAKGTKSRRGDYRIVMTLIKP